MSESSSLSGLMRVMDGESDTKTTVYSRVNSTFRSLDEVLNITSEEDARDVLQVLIWKYMANVRNDTITNTMRYMFTNHKLPAFWEPATVFTLVNGAGIFADVFVQQFDSLVRDIPRDLLAMYLEKRDRIRGAAIQLAPPLPPPSANAMMESENCSSSSSATSLPLPVVEPTEPMCRRFSRKLSGKIQPTSVDDNEGVEFYRQNIAEGLVAMANELASLYDLKLSRNKEIPPAEMDDEDYQDFFNALVDELNEYLQSKNEELDIQHENYVKVCELVKLAQAQVLEVLQSGGFTRKDIDLFAKSAVSALQSLENCTTAEVTVAVCGETSTGKTTLIAGVAGSLCFPTSDAANSACPIRIAVSNDPEVPRCFHIPTAFRVVLDNAFDAVRLAVKSLATDRIPNDIPANVVSAEAITMYSQIASDYNNVELRFAPEVTDGSDEQIRDAINNINALIRLVYNLKDSPRFESRLAHVHPLSVLLDATDIVSLLPTVTAYCIAVQGLPFLGKINIIDTPGVSEVGEKGSFMEFNKRIVQKIFEKTDRTIILTTPTSTQSTAFKDLRHLVKATVDGVDRMLIAVNKFDTVEATNGLFNELKRYRAEFAREGCGSIHVQVLKAKVLRDIVFGMKDIKELGGMKFVKANKKTLSGATVSLLTSLYGQTFHKHIDRFTDADLLADSANLARQSNFDNIIRIALMPAFLKAMSKEPILCLKYNSKLAASLITTLNTRLASLLKKEEALKLLIDSVSKIDTQFLDKMDAIEAEIEVAMLNEFGTKAHIGINNAMQAIKTAVAECEKEAIKSQGILPASANRVVKTVCVWNGAKYDVEYKTRVYYSRPDQCDAENLRVIARVNNLLRATGIEASWEKARMSILTGTVAKYLGILKHSIYSSLESELENDGSLAAMYESIQSEILNCQFSEEIPVAPTCICTLNPHVETQTKAAEGLRGFLAYWFQNFIDPKYASMDIYIPQYGVIKNVCDLMLRDHYSQENCRKQLALGLSAHKSVLNKVGDQLRDLRDSLQNLHKRVSSTVETEDADALRRGISKLSGTLREHVTLTQAITHKCTVEKIEENLLNTTLQVEAWRHRLIDSAGSTNECMTSMLAHSPIHDLFDDCDDTINYEGATSDVVAACLTIENLRPYFTEMQESIDLALKHAQLQQRKGQMPENMTLDELAAMKLYTLPCCFFRIINTSLREFDVTNIKACRRIIWLIKTSLNKLLPSPKDTVFRGLKGTLTFPPNQKTLLLPAFTSTTTDLKVCGSEEFFGDGPRTFFMIRLAANTVARSLRQVSVLPEEEVLFPPFAVFEIESIGDISTDGRLDVWIRECVSVDPIVGVVEDPATTPEPAVAEDGNATGEVVDITTTANARGSVRVME